MNQNICAPGRYDAKNNTCFSIEQLVEMAKGYNRYISKNFLKPNSKSPSKLELIKISENKPYLLREIKRRFDKECGDDEMCLTQQAFMNEIVKEMHDDILYETIRPPGPPGNTDWLSTTEIELVLKQYQNVYPNFEFVGAVPLDCNDLSFCQLYKLDFDKYLSRGKKYLGVVFNYDKHGQNGSHWVSLFIDLKGEIDYCDSMGQAPIQNINTVINQFLDYYKKKNRRDAIYKSNSKPYQLDSSECGVYSCNFIIRRLAGESFEHVIKNSLNFEEINSCRNVYFSNGSSKYEVHKYCDPK